MKTTKYIRWLGFLLTFGTILPIFATPAKGFENLALLKNHSETCQIVCHEPEISSRIKADKSRKKSCKACHEGIQIKVTKSPFLGSLQFKKTLRPTNQLKAKGYSTSINIDESLEENINENPKPPPKMVYIPPGKFIMGSNDRWDDESPEHIANTKAFFIDLYEVTNRNFKKYVDANKIAPPFHWPEGILPKSKLDHPVVYVNWFDADGYCKWVGKRLPNEIEWEKAARGKNGNIYPWGNIWVLNRSNNPYNNSTGTEPVGSYPKGRSPYGLYDMSGNVWEWVDSYYLPHPGNEIARPEYGKENRVLKGGSWFDCLSYGCGISAPTFNRSFFTPEVRNNSFGFRCAKSTPKVIAHTKN